MIYEGIEPVVKVISLEDFDFKKAIAQINTLNDAPFGRYAAKTLQVRIDASFTDTVNVVYRFAHSPNGWAMQAINPDAVVKEYQIFETSNFDELGIDPSELIDSRYPQEAGT